MQRATKFLRYVASPFRRSMSSNVPTKLGTLSRGRATFVIEKSQDGKISLKRDFDIKDSSLEATGQLQLLASSSIIQRILDYLLPKNFPHSVTEEYLPYVRWQAVQTALGSAAGVLSMQSLLYAVGLGAATAVPAAAALNWVLKDGLGQVGGVVFASFVSTNFDADPKRWRMIAGHAMNAAMLVEILTPLVPSLFVPIASLANGAKNVSWLAASASKAAIHKSFLKDENLADVTVKAGSQSIVASVIGTALGIGLSTLTGSSVAPMLAAFIVLAAAQTFANYYSLRRVVIPTLNPQRLELLLTHALRAPHQPIPTPHEAARNEHFLLPYRSPYAKTSRLHFSKGAEDMFTSGNTIDLALLQRMSDEWSYLLHIEPSSQATTVNVLLVESAVNRDVIIAYIHASLIRAAIEAGEKPWEWSWEQHQLKNVRAQELLKQMVERGWSVDHNLLEQEVTRFAWPAKQV